MIPRSDVYAQGVILYELVTGAVPFDGFSASEVAQKHLTVSPTPPSRRRAGVPGSIDKARILRAKPVTARSVNNS